MRLEICKPFFYSKCLLPKLCVYLYDKQLMINDDDHLCSIVSMITSQYLSYPKSALIQEMDWHRSGVKLFLEAMLTKTIYSCRSVRSFTPLTLRGVGVFVIIGSRNGLAPSQRQSIS